MTFSARKQSRAAAFTLVEVIVCMTIMSILFVSLYGGIASGFAVVNLARENLRANQIIVEKMETIRLYNWNQVNSNGFIPPTFTAPFFPTVITNIVTTNSDGTVQSTSASFEGTGGLTYFGTVSITNAPMTNAYSASMRLVIVSLTWTNNNIPRTRQLQSLIAENGMQNYVYY